MIRIYRLARRYSRFSHLLIVVALAEVPQAGLVEIVKTNATGDGVDKLGVLDRGRDDVGKRQPEEINFTENLVILGLAELNLFTYD